MWQATDRVPDLYRTTLKSALDMMNVCLGGVERMQGYQAGAIEEMRSGQGEMAKQLGTVDSLQDLQAAHAELARSQMARMTSYWGGLYAAGCQTQVEMLKEAQVKARVVADEIGLKLEAAPAGVAPFMSAMKLAVDAAHSTYAATVRATEEMVRVGTAQIDAANARAARQGNGKVKRAA